MPDLEEVEVREPDIHPLGFNMCEAGLEGIQVKISKKSCNKEADKDVEETAWVLLTMLQLMLPGFKLTCLTIC